MSTFERIFHSFLFELLALGVAVPIAMWITGAGAKEMTATALVLSLAAMTWNYIYNVGFDKVFGANRIKRTFVTRLIHTIGFEIGLLAFALPFIMWSLNMSLWEALVLDLGFIVFFLGYALAFNWLYDHARAWLERRSKLQPLAN